MGALPVQHRLFRATIPRSPFYAAPSLLQRHGPHTNTLRPPSGHEARRQPGSGGGAARSSSQPNAELLGEQLEALSPSESTMEVLLSAEADAEGEELDPAALALLAGQPAASRASESLDENPYTPQDALSGVGSGRPRYGSLGQSMPASPELEQLLEAAEASDGQVTMEQLQSLFPFQLDGFQEKAVQQLLEGKSVVVCAPTGAGKTAIAEAAAAATLARGQRVIYTTPLKALSNQKLAETAARFGSSRCGLQTGDTSLNTEADIVVMTTEILRNIMYRTAEVVGGSGKPGSTRDERLGDVGLVVLDEVHYLGDPWRGSVWEEAIINCPRHIQLLAMSATVKNPDDLGGWISQVHGDCATIKTRFRPVPLRWVFCYRAPKTGVQLADLMLPHKGSRQQQDSSSSSMLSGRLNPELRVDAWVDEEIKFQMMREQRQQRQLARSIDQVLWDGPQDGAPLGSQPSDGSWSDDNEFYYQQQQQRQQQQRRPSRDFGGGGRGGGRFGSRGRQDGGPGRFSSGDFDRQELTRKVMGKRTPPQDQVIRQLQMNQLLPAIWFIMSRKDCDMAAIASNVLLVNQQEEAELLDELQALYDDNQDAVREKLVPAFLAGVASHHAGCLPAWKSLVERCFQRGLLKLVFATGTLAAGINMPARTTVISNLARRSDDGIQPMPHNELLQMAGRAGRRGFDTQGQCVLVQGRFEGAEVAHGIITAGPEPLQSQFTTSYSLVLNLLSVYSLEEARDFLSKSFGTYLSQEGKQRRKAAVEQLIAQAKEITRLATQSAGPSDAQKAAAALVKKHKSRILALRSKATAERCQVVQQLISQTPAAAAAAADADPSSSAAAAAAAVAAADAGSSCFTPQLLLLNLSRHPNDDSAPPQYLPALAVRQVQQPPFPPTSARDAPPGPLLLCLGGDNRPMAVSAQHVVGFVADAAVLQQQVLLGQEEPLQRLQSLLDESLDSPKVWANLAKTMFSCQVTYGSALTAGLAVKLNLPLEAFEAVSPTADTQAAIEQQLREVAAAKLALQQARREEQQQQQQAQAEAVTNGSGNGSSSSSSQELLAKGGGVPMLTARRLMKQAKKLLEDVGEEEGQQSTWNSFMDVLGILVELGAMEAGSLRLLPLGLVARSINCNNELWMAAALSHPGVMNLTPPQLAAFVGALQCTDLLKRPMSIWSSFQVSEVVVALVEELEPTREAIFEAQTAGGQTRWNEHLAVDLRLAGLVEAWAGGASWSEVMQDTSLDDGDMARLLARTADMLKQLVYLDEQLPYLVDTARQALRGMDRKPISDLVA